MASTSEKSARTQIRCDSFPSIWTCFAPVGAAALFSYWQDTSAEMRETWAASGCRRENEEKGLRTCGGELGEALMTGVCVNSSSCIDCRERSAGRSTATVHLIPFLSYYLSSANFVKLRHWYIFFFIFLFFMPPWDSSCGPLPHMLPT